MCSMGIDPGASGAAVITADKGDYLYSFVKKTRAEIFLELSKLIKEYSVKRAFIEDVHPMKGWSIQNNETFVKNICTVHLACEVAGIVPSLIPPKTWQKAFKGVTKKQEGGESKIKQIAQELRPTLRIKRIDEAEAVLILEAGLKSSL